jgi:hypothetical protein
MIFTWVAMLIAGVLFAAMLVTFEVGRRIGVAQLGRDPDGLAKGVGAAEGAVFALLGLLMAFTFSGAASRFEARRLMIDNEVNAIGTAYLRLDLLPAEAQPQLRKMFKQYAMLRSTVYRDVVQISEVEKRIANGTAMQGEIWNSSLAAIQRPGAASQAGMLLLPALNEAFDIAATRHMSTSNHPPLVIFVLLGVLSVLGATLVGYSSLSNRRRTWMHPVSFALVMSLAFYVIVDLEFPRLGMIRVDAADQLLVELANSMR